MYTVHQVAVLFCAWVWVGVKAHDVEISVLLYCTDLYVYI